MNKACRRITLLGAFGLLGCQAVCAQVVQLPSYRVFGIGTSVLVPDRGTAVLGGVNRAFTGERTQGWPLISERTLDRARGASSAQVRVTILDHRQWDAAILGQASSTPRAASTVTQIRARRISRQLTEPAAGVPESTVTLSAEAKRRQHRQQAADNLAARQLIARGDLCHRRDQSPAARIFYRTAWRQSHGAVRDLARARLEDLAR